MAIILVRILPTLLAILIVFLCMKYKLNKQLKIESNKNRNKFLLSENTYNTILRHLPEEDNLPDTESMNKAYAEFIQYQELYNE